MKPHIEVSGHDRAEEFNSRKTNTCETWRCLDNRIAETECPSTIPWKLGGRGGVPSPQRYREKRVQIGFIV
jgi:hypothetical protein